jgi:hypothetical protein
MGAVIRFLQQILSFFFHFSILKSIIVLLRYYSKIKNLQTKSHEHNYEIQSKN